MHTHLHVYRTFRNCFFIYIHTKRKWSVPQNRTNLDYKRRSKQQQQQRRRKDKHVLWMLTVDAMPA